MNDDVMIFLTREELELLKNEIVDIVTTVSTEQNLKCIDKEWIINLASKLIKSCKEADETKKSMEESVKAIKENTNKIALL